MTNLSKPHRWATREDAVAMARLVDIAGEGFPLYFWGTMSDGTESALDVGRARAQRETGSFSYRNTVVREEEGQVVACLIGYPLPDVPDAVDYSTLPAITVPLQKLEDMAPGTWYVNVLASFPEHRGKGYGKELLQIAEKLAIDAGKQGLSIIVSDGNTGARRLYERTGYAEKGRLPMVKEAWDGRGENWVLLVKRL